MTPWLIIADDLTGAADCAIAFAKRGVETVVTWGEGEVADVPVISVDADSRRLSAAEAAARQTAVLAARHQPGRRLYKKIDSTLRGQPAAETAALLQVLRRQRRDFIAFVAPAFPATGRTTENARVLVNGKRLEDTPLWAREHTYETGYLPSVLASAGLHVGVIPRDQLRRGDGNVRGVVSAAIAEGCDAVVCDAVSEDDLRIAAEATLPLADRLLYVGTGGLASALAGVAAPDGTALPLAAPSPGHVLVLVGSLAEVSRAATAQLVSAQHIRDFRIPEALLLNAKGTATARRELTAKIGAALCDEDVVVETEFGPASDLKRGADVAAHLAALVAPATVHAGGIVATGGDTVFALLARLGVTGIQLYDEVEPGVPFGITVGAARFPIATKAGGFGDEATLARCVDRIHQIIAQQGQ